VELPAIVAITGQVTALSFEVRTPVVGSTEQLDGAPEASWNEIAPPSLPPLALICTVWPTV
jgi:hypothetical protein